MKNDPIKEDLAWRRPKADAMKKLYLFSNPYDDRFARACRLGTWVSDSGLGLCPECGMPQEKRVRPLIMEWEPGSQVIGDFSWPGNLDDIVVTTRVKNRLDGLITGVEFSSLIVKDAAHSKSRKTKVRASLARKQAETTALWDMWVTAWSHLDHAASRLVMERECNACHYRYFRPPARNKKLVLDPASWHGESVFKCYELPVWIFAVEEVRDMIIEEEFTNVVFREIGIVGSTGSRVAGRRSGRRQPKKRPQPRS
jgi:hypothetical protein